MESSHEFKFSGNSQEMTPGAGGVLNRTKLKLADCDMVIHEGPLAGFTLRGFVIWKRSQDGRFEVTGPNRLLLNRHGYRETYTLLRPQSEDTGQWYLRLSGPLALDIIEAFTVWYKGA